MSRPEAAPKPLSRVQRLAIRVGPWIIRALASTWRIRVINDAPWRARHAAGEPFIFSLWHGTLLPLVWIHRNGGVAVLVSEHRDGEVIAQIIQRLGFNTIRGSTSRGAARALLAMVRTLQAGTEVAVTPDGPRGPRHSFAPGALIAAQRSGAPIIAIGLAVSRTWRLRSWDQFLIPKPFATLAVVYHDPVFVDSADARAASDEIARFQALMQDVSAAAARG